MSPSTFAGLVSRALAAADRVPRRLGPPTEFELLTAMVFTWFAEERVDLAVVEVGLGGRLDATHAWDGGVAAITNVDLDHMDRLGPTIKHIAREKAAIIERGDRRGDRGDRRRARDRPAAGGASRRAAADRRAGPDRRAVAGRHRGRAAAPGADADRPARAAPGGERGGGRRRPGRARGGRDRVRAGGRATDGYANARWPGRLELLSIDGRRRAARRRPQPCRRRGARDRARRPAAVPRAGPRQRRRRRRWRTRTSTASSPHSRALRPSAARGSSRPSSTFRGRSPPTSSRSAGRARRSRDGRSSTEPDPATALDRALATADGPVDSRRFSVPRRVRPGSPRRRPAAARPGAGAR